MWVDGLGHVLYEVNEATWEWDDYDKDYTYGPFFDKSFMVDTEEEAHDCITKCKAWHPSVYDAKIDYVKEDPDNGILHRELVCSYGDKKENYRYEFNVFKIIRRYGLPPRMPWQK